MVHNFCTFVSLPPQGARVRIEMTGHSGGGSEENQEVTVYFEGKSSADRNNRGADTIPAGLYFLPCGESDGGPEDYLGRDGTPKGVCPEGGRSREGEGKF